MGIGRSGEIGASRQTQKVVRTCNIIETLLSQWWIKQLRSGRLSISWCLEIRTW